MNNDTRFANQYNIQWFPGHMTKTLRMMETEIQHVDASLVLLDARIPLSSLNPEVERITARKPKRKTGRKGTTCCPFFLYSGPDKIVRCIGKWKSMLQHRKLCADRMCLSGTRR